MGVAGAEVFAPIAALLTALCGIVTVLWRMYSESRNRVDTITAGQIRSITDERDRWRTERDEAVQRCATAEKEAERWAEKCQDMTMRAMKAELHLELLRGMGSSGDATPSP
jgi:hypothetical protein